MPLTQKQEDFALAYIETGNAGEAYKRAYNTKTTNTNVINVEGCRVLANPKISLRVAELRAKAATVATVTLAGHLADLKELRDQAIEARQFGPAIAAEVARGKAAGVHVEKTESTVTTRELPASVDEFV